MSSHPRDEQESTKSKGKNWVFTINNYPPELPGILQQRFSDTKHYCVFKKEVCPTTNTKHLQGLVCFTDRLRWAQARAFFDNPDGTNNSWLKTMRGTIEQAETYVSKEDTADPSDNTVYRIGSRPSGQGARNDLSDIVSAIADHKSEREVFEIDPSSYIKYSTGIKRAIALTATKRNFKTIVYWFYGPTGTGKSKLANEITGNDVYYKSPNNDWWEAYQNEKFVIIDDYRTNMCTFSELLRLFDRYPHKVNIKGSHAEFNSNIIIVTTPKTPQETWQTRSSEDINQLVRRITDVVLFSYDQPPWSTVYNKEFTFDINNQHEDRNINNTVVFKPI